MLISRDISPDAFAAMPAFLADGQALRRSFLADPSQSDSEAVARAVRDLTGIEITGPIVWRYLRQPGERYALLVLHRFTAPITAEADLIVISSRYVFGRQNVFDFALDLITEVGVRKLIARIPSQRIDLEDYARRAGFRFDGLHIIDDSPVGIWSITPDDLLCFGRKWKGK